jgi:hypothetical protein
MSAAEAFESRLEKDSEAGRPVRRDREFATFVSGRIETEPEYLRLREQLTSLDGLAARDLTQRPVREFQTEPPEAYATRGGDAGLEFEDKVEEARALCRDVARTCRRHLALLGAGVMPEDLRLVDAEPDVVLPADPRVVRRLPPTA